MNVHRVSKVYIYFLNHSVKISRFKNSEEIWRVYEISNYIFKNVTTLPCEIPKSHFQQQMSWTFTAANRQVLRGSNLFYFFHRRETVHWLPYEHAIWSSIYMIFDWYIQKSKMWIFDTRCIIISDKKLSYRSPIRRGTAWRTMWVEILSTPAQLYEKSYLNRHAVGG